MRIYIKIEVEDDMPDEAIEHELNICLGAVDSEFTATAKILGVFHESTS